MCFVHRIASQYYVPFGCAYRSRVHIMNDNFDCFTVHRCLTSRCLQIFQCGCLKLHRGQLQCRRITADVLDSINVWPVWGRRSSSGSCEFECRRCAMWSEYVQLRSAPSHFSFFVHQQTTGLVRSFWTGCVIFGHAVTAARYAKRWASWGCHRKHHRSSTHLTAWRHWQHWRGLRWHCGRCGRLQSRLIQQSWCKHIVCRLSARVVAIQFM